MPPRSPKKVSSNRLPRETPERARVAGTSPARRIVAAVTTSRPVGKLALRGEDVVRGQAGHPQQGVHQVVAGVGQESPAGDLGVEPPRAFGPSPFLFGEPGLGHHGRNQAERADGVGRQPLRASIRLGRSRY